MPPRSRFPNGHGLSGGSATRKMALSSSKTPAPDPGAGVSPSLGLVPPLVEVELRGYQRLALIADLAMGELSVRELALREDVPQAAILRFKEEHADEIVEVGQALSGNLAVETAGLWVTRKQNRLAEYQDQIEEIRDHLADLRGSGVRWSRSHRDMLRAYLDLFRQTADELGAYPQRSSPPARQGQTVHYVIETSESEALT